MTRRVADREGAAAQHSGYRWRVARNAHRPEELAVAGLPNHVRSVGQAQEFARVAFVEASFDAQPTLATKPHNSGRDRTPECYQIEPNRSARILGAPVSSLVHGLAARPTGFERVTVAQKAVGRASHFKDLDLAFRFGSVISNWNDVSDRAEITLQPLHVGRI
jgi:hypothetical protein